MAKKSEDTRAPKRKAAARDPEVPAKTAPKARKSRAQSKKPDAEAKSRRKKAAAPAVKAASAAKAKAPATKTRKAKVGVKDETGEPLEVPPTTPVPIPVSVEDPIGDVSSGEARFSLSDAEEPESRAGMAAYRADTADDALEATLENRPDEPGAKWHGTGFSPYLHPGQETGALAPEGSPSPIEPDTAEAAGGKGPAEPRPPAKLERLQKILSRAGIASRRHAEEMIEAGRVVVNGQIVAQLGAKADPARDHIRVDGKLIAGAERHRYFVLNKPRGYVTTVSDPEGRPTVMQFFSKMNERLYPVGRLDYDSEGLLLVTNDGELANQLTRAASGVEKTYLVKVAGQPTEGELDRLRSGVAIEQDKPGSDKVHTAPARINRIRQGDNPWYEVVLIEGRNRELRKMFEQVGHFVEKIRRVGYGPLVLDLEPGKLRELAPEEVSILRLAAEGKWKPRSPQTGLGLRGDKPRRPKTDKMPPRQTGRPSQRGARDIGERGGRVAEQPGARDVGQRGAPNLGPRGAKDFGQRGAGNFGQRSAPQPPRGERPFREKPGWKPRDERSGATPGEQRPFRGRPGFASGAGTRSAGRGFTSPSQQRRPERDQGPNQAPNSGSASRPGWGKPPAPARGDGAARPGQRPAFTRHDQPNKRFDKPRARNFGERPVRDFENKPPRRFDQPRGESGNSRPGKTWDREAGRRPDRSRAPDPARSPARSPDRGPARPDGSAPVFPGKFKPAFKPAPGGRPAPEGRERPAPRANFSGAAPGPRGFSAGRFSKPGGNRFGFKGKPGGAKRGGPPSGGKRPGGRKRG